MNDIYNQMLTAYDQSTEQQKRNAVFEVNQQIILAGLCHGGFFDVAAPVSAFSTAYSVFRKIWTSPSLLQKPISISHNTSNLSLTNLQWWAEMLK